MKKFFYLLLSAATMFMVLPVMTSCEPVDDEEYYAGESEEDYKPNAYTVKYEWDLSNVTSLSTDQQKSIKTELDKLSFTRTFNTRTEAVSYFDNAVNEAKNDADMKQYKGLKCTMKLIRGTAIIKKATLTW